MHSKNNWLNFNSKIEVCHAAQENGAHINQNKNICVHNVSLNESIEGALLLEDTTYIPNSK